MNADQSLHEHAAARRPLKVRDLGGWRPLAEYCLRCGITANMVSLIGLGAGIGAGLLLAATGIMADVVDIRLFLPGVLVLMLLRAVCNILDGVIAVEAGAGTPVGELFNEVPDRLSDAAALIGAGYAVGGHPVLGWAAALVAVFTAYVRVECHHAGATADYRGLFGKPGRMLVLVAAVLLLFVPGMAAASWSIGGSGSIGVMGLALGLVAVGSAFTSANRLRRAVHQLQGISSR